MMKVKKYASLKENSSSTEEKLTLLSLNSLISVAFRSDSEKMKSFGRFFAKFSAKDTPAMSSCLLGLLVLWCTRANFAQNLLLMNLFMHAIVLTAILHKSCTFLIVKTSCISIFYLIKAHDYCDCIH